MCAYFLNQGEAKSAQLIGDAIANNPAFITLRKIEASREIANTVSSSANRIMLNSEGLMLNLEDLATEIKWNCWLSQTNKGILIILGGMNPNTKHSAVLRPSEAKYGYSTDSKYNWLIFVFHSRNNTEFWSVHCQDHCGKCEYFLECQDHSAVNVSL